MISDFLVVQQNATNLLKVDGDQGSALDGIAQEDLWFRGDSNANWLDKRGGDIRSPQAERHAILKRLATFRATGRPVFTVDYCLIRKHARFVYVNSQRLGFVPLVTRVSVSRITCTPPTRVEVGTFPVSGPSKSQ